jgi:ribosomal protein L44E
MDWARAVKINRIALSQIVAEILAMLGLAVGGTVERMPRALYVAAERLLRPAESALRRLIFIAARGLVIQPSPSRPMPKVLFNNNKGSSRMSFRLFDKRAVFEFISPQNPVCVMVQTYNDNPFNLFNSLAQPQADESHENISGAQLCRRLAALAHGLENIPSQARRLARWTARRKSCKTAKFTNALRPGPPPGHRTKPTKPIDFILRECHALAFDVLKADTS